MYAMSERFNDKWHEDIEENVGVLMRWKYEKDAVQQYRKERGNGRTKLDWNAIIKQGLIALTAAMTVITALIYVIQTLLERS